MSLLFLSGEDLGKYFRTACKNTTLRLLSSAVLQFQNRRTKWKKQDQEARLCTRTDASLSVSPTADALHPELIIRPDTHDQISNGDDFVEDCSIQRPLDESSRSESRNGSDEVGREESSANMADKGGDKVGNNQK